MKKRSLYLLLPICSLLSAWVGWKSHGYHTDIESQVITAQEANVVKEPWGEITIYTDENSATTYGTKNTLSAMAHILPGQEIHPPHQHTAEEFMYIIEGNGTWNLNGELQEAKAGDLLYASPWEWHGIKNTGSTPLRFFVVKWDNKGVPLPVKGSK